MKLPASAHIHFIGIGGIGMSSQAILAAGQGYRVSGCDTGISDPILHRLQAVGITVFKTHSPSHLKGVDLFVFTSAIDPKLDELAEAKAKNCPVMHRAEFLAVLMQKFPHRIAVGGAHGKTTTTSLITWILHATNKNPTAVVGGVISGLGNAISGSDRIFVAEADESDRSFLNFSPTISVVTNIDAEHLDIYNDLTDIKQTFLRFINKTTDVAIICTDNEHLRTIIPSVNCPIISYGIDSLHNPDLLAVDIKLNPTEGVFKLRSKFFDSDIGPIKIPLTGRHNICNTLAAIAVALKLKISMQEIVCAIATFPGVERRFEFKGTCNGAEVFDDYGHHPTEIAVTVTAALNRTRRRLFLLFQPHRYSRTKLLFNEFVSLFQTMPFYRCYILDIYAASEPFSLPSSEDLTKAIARPNVIYAKSWNSVEQELRDELSDGDLLLTIGAGEQFKIAEAVVSNYSTESVCD